MHAATATRRDLRPAAVAGLVLRRQSTITNSSSVIAKLGVIISGVFRGRGDGATAPLWCDREFCVISALFL